MRPTAVNLSWTTDRMLRAAGRNGTHPAEMAAGLLAGAHVIQDEDEIMCRLIGAIAVP